MPITDIQRNHAPVFSVRFGEKQGNRPVKLMGKIRVTSSNRNVVQAFVDQYGGEVRQWEEGWEAYLPRTDLPIMVLPGQSIQQWWELYKGGTCDRRCDGETETLSGKPCICPSNIDERIADKYSCSPMTRLTFLCPEVEILGAGSLVTHGKIAAETLPQAVSVAEAALARGEMVPATLRAVQKVGKNRQYVIPQIEITGTSLLQLMSGSAGNAGALTAPSGEDKALPVASDASGVEHSAPTLGRVLDARQAKTAGSSAGGFATDPQRQAIMRTATRKKVNSEDLETLILEKTGKYLDEADFTVDMVNDVLDELNKKEG